MTTDLHTTTNDAEPENDVEPENDGAGESDTTNPPAEKPAAGKAAAEKAAAEKPSARAQLAEYLTVRRHPVVAAVSMLCVAALVAVGVLAYLLVQRSDDLAAERQLTADKQTAETIAGRYAVGAATFDFNNLQPWSAALKNGTAPELNSRFDVAVSTLTPLIQEVQWVQTAKLIAAKTVDIRADRQFIVQVFVSTHMTSTQNPKGLNTVTPYTITLDRDSKWLITDVAGIAGAAQDGSSGSGSPNLTQTDAGTGTQGSSTQGNGNQGNSNQGSGNGTGGQAPAAPAQPTP
ncbi:MULTISPECIES: serine/threonine protein kinase [unclassified Gordonia (in: high G+C Gram-positive bacteria)]|uniref:serine/threonine protein kinase n=1 Tax=unclassified Gordonia (in: high G+C Gram-positive bacteria) TaxID=2657482 RepID=UPI000B0CE8AC|nr:MULTISPECIES: serine/threonine protein kinase [unclassified Gordonia (in: high G+C Gram-positive bacteria)]